MDGLEIRIVARHAQEVRVLLQLKENGLLGPRHSMTHGSWHDPVWTTQNAEHQFAYIATAFRNAGLLAAESGDWLIGSSMTRCGCVRFVFTWSPAFM